MPADAAPGQDRVLRGRLVTGQPAANIIDDGAVWLAGDRIEWCGPASALPSGAPDRVEQVPVILPGLVDLHCHGGAGHTFSADPNGARAIAAHHAANGTTSLLASLVSAPANELLAQIEALRDLVDDGTLAGLHLEGPFIAADMCGAQNPAAIIDGDPALLRQWLEAGRGTIRSLTLAPETAHFDELVALCRQHGVVPSVGHTAATAAQMRAALEHNPGGTWSATHLFNRMPPLDHRRPGPIAVLLETARRAPDSMVLELIADGAHLHPDTVRMVFGLVGADGIALITDAMAAAGMSDGDYALGTLDVEVRNGTARLASPDGTAGAIAGGTSRLLENVRRCRDWGINLADAVAAASSTPARLIGNDDVGMLSPGRRADVVVASDELEVLQVYRSGALQQPAPKERS
ncbi:N-acetylglucosamine-6-phosphate deacetylase [Arthrobacter tumbae]|uniref:N-acetylglucosamine-6-phosphate deacetylase n=1 Tax=Arthrobacter tumbae TaxID=163874 RepID=UPI00195B10C4|nr:N-acetylglucosamine-6-phosphate deacetylase [Arthrobacter tumbae]